MSKYEPERGGVREGERKQLRRKERKEKDRAREDGRQKEKARTVSRESQCRLCAPAPGATHPLPACQLKPWLKPTKCLQMKKELLEVLTAEACQLHCQRKAVREEQEGIAMTRKAGGTDEYKISHSMLFDSPYSSRSYVRRKRTEKLTFRLLFCSFTPPLHFVYYFVWDFLCKIHF